MLDYSTLLVKLSAMHKPYLYKHAYNSAILCYSDVPLKLNAVVIIIIIIIIMYLFPQGSNKKKKFI